MKYKTVDDGCLKGIIITAESLLDMKDEIEQGEFTVEERKGAEAVYTFIKQCYDKAHNKPKKTWFGRDL